MNETNPNLIFIKLGGSLITDKTIPRKADLARIRALAAEIKHIHQSRPNLRMILGHGSGSFGHMEAHKYGTVQGVRSPEEWQGFQKVWSAAHELNQIVLSELLDAGLPVVNFPPSATVTLANHSVTVWNLEPMQACLDHGLIPLVFGDVVTDRVIGGTILSTEELFCHLALHFKPAKVLIAGLERGVYQDYPANTEIVTEIRAGDALRTNLGSSQAVDVTGGMLSKVLLLSRMASQVPGLQARIFSGDPAGNLTDFLDGRPLGTCISL